MSAGVTNGQLANENTFNQAFMARNDDTDTVGKVGLKNTAVESGVIINNAQKYINHLGDVVGATENGGSGDLDYTAPNYIVDGDTHKVAIQKLDTKAKDLQDQVDAHEARLDADEAVIATHETRLDAHDVTLADHETRLDDIESNNSTFGGDKVFTGDVLVQGNFEVQGSVTSINSTDLEVEDQLVTINKNGTNLTAEGSGFEVERPAGNAAFVFDSTLASKFKIGLAAALKEVLVSGVAQVVSGIKDFVSGIKADTISESTSDTGVTADGVLLKDKFVLADNLAGVTEVDSTTTGSDQQLSSLKMVVKLTNATLVSINRMQLPSGLAKSFFRVLVNNTGNEITIKHNAGSPSNERILTPTEEDLALPDKASIILVYDMDALSWRVASGVGTGDGGSGSGFGKNYFPNQGKFNSTIASVSTFNTTFSGGVPTTITPGSTKVAIALETTNPLSDKGSLKFSVVTASGSQGHGFISSVMTIDDADLARGFMASFDYFITSGIANLDLSQSALSTFQVWVYNVGLNKWYQLKNFWGIKSGANDTLEASFVSDISKVSNNNQYQFALIVANDPSGPADILIDNFYFGRSGNEQQDLTGTYVEVNGNQGGSFTSGVDEKIIYQNKVSDKMSVYNNSTGDLTVKIPGTVKAKASCLFGGSYALGNTTAIRIRKNGSDVADGFLRNAAVGGASILTTIEKKFDVVAGDVITFHAYSEGTSPSFLNIPIYDFFEFTYEQSNLQSGSGIDTPVVFRSATSVSGTLNSSFNLADFSGGIIEDTLNCYSGGQYTVKKPGFYDLGASVYVAGSPAGPGEFTAISIRRNGTDVCSNFSRSVTSGGNGPVGAQTHTKGVWLNAGDVIDAHVATSLPSPSYSSGLSSFENNFYIVSSSSAKAENSSKFIPRLYVYNGSSATLASATTQKIALDSFFNADLNNCKEWFDTGLNRFTPKKPGIYNCRNGLFLTGTTNRSYGVIIKNGSELWASSPSGGISGDTGMNGSADIPMNGTTDYLEFYGFTFGGPAGIPSSYVDVYMQCRWVSDL